MIPFKQVTAVTSSGLQTVLELERLDCDQMNIDVSNAGPQALSAFEISIKTHADAAYKVIASVAGDYATPVGFNWASDTGLVTLASGATGWLTLDNLRAMYAVRIRATSAGNSVLTLAGQMGPN
jgi:hypothetical protein